MNALHAELAAHALRNIQSGLDDLRFVIREATETCEIYPLWESLRTEAVKAMQLCDIAGDKLNAILKQDV